mgnify:CR=1 FL=1
MNNRLEETPQIDDTDIILEVHKISKRFGGIKALNNIGFFCQKGRSTRSGGREWAGRAPLLRFLQVPTHLAKVKSCLTERNIAD